MGCVAAAEDAEDAETDKFVSVANKMRKEPPKKKWTND